MAEDIAIVGFAQTPSCRTYSDSEPSMILGIVNQILGEIELDRHEIGFTIAGSCDYLLGLPFSFIANVDGYGAWPPVYESHVEMDGAWALFEAFVRLQIGDIDLALVVGSGKSSSGAPLEIFPLQTDPYVHAPLGLDPVSIAGLQARALLDAGKATERDFAEVVSRSRRDGLSNPNAQVAKDVCRQSPMVRRPCSSRAAHARGSCARSRSGSAVSTTASSLTTWACAT